ncbi:MAG: response regulator transcription factor, partial [Saprospiraceae bacterium]
SERGLTTTLCHSGVEGVDTFQKGGFDLCILDVKMPFKDGFSVAREIRALDPSVPFIFLTGEAAKENKIKGFHLGAEDYVTKPFSMEELYLRIQVVLRRSGSKMNAQAQKNEYSIGKYVFRPAARELTLGTDSTKLSAIEAKLLHYFCDADQGIIDRDVALRRVWGDDDQLRGRSLNVYVSKLRQYLKDDPGIEILNIHGEGYQMVVR